MGIVSLKTSISAKAGLDIAPNPPKKALGEDQTEQQEDDQSEVRDKGHNEWLAKIPETS